MQAEYIAKITGDTSGLEKAVQKANGITRKLEDDEVLIKLDYDGNIKQFNKVVSGVIKDCPELTIQFQYDINKKVLDEQLTKLKDIEDFKIDVDTQNIQNKVNSMVQDIKNGFETAAYSEDDLFKKIKYLFSYINTAKKSGFDVRDSFDVIDELGERYSKIGKLFERRDSLQLFKIDKNLDNTLIKTKNEVEDIQDALSDLRNKGASDRGKSEVDALSDEIKILRSDIKDLEDQMQNLNGDKFEEMADQVRDLRDALSEVMTKLGMISATSLKEILPFLSGLGKPKGGQETKYLEHIGQLFDSLDDKSKQLLKDLGLLNSDGGINPIIDGANNLGGLVGEKNTAIIRSSTTTSIENAQKLKAALDEAYESGVNCSRIISVIETGDNEILELQTTIKGNSFQDSNTFDFDANALKASDEQIRKLYVDMKKLWDLGIATDINPSNFIYDQLKGFGIIDLDFIDNVSDEMLKYESFEQLWEDFVRNLKDNIDDSDIGQVMEQFASKAESIGSTAGNKIGDALVNGVRQGIDAHSDSQEGIKIADDFVNGIVHEIDNRISDVESAGTRLGEAIVEAVDEKVNGGDKISLTGYHGSSQKWTGNSFDFSKTKASQLGSGMYFVDSPEKLKGFLSRPGSGDIKQTELNLKKCFVLTEDYISSISDINKILGTTFDETSDAKDILTAIRNYNKSSKVNSDNFRKSMLEMGYQGMYVGDFLANKKIKDELVVYDESLIQDLTSIPKTQFQSIIDGATEASGAIIEYSNSVKEASESNDFSSNNFSPTQQFDNTIQKDIVYLENYKNTIEEINQLKLQPQTDETEKKLEELQKLADYFFGSISITRNQLGNDGGRFSSDFYGTYRNRLASEGYGDYAKEIFKIGEQLGSSLDINHLSDSFVGIEEEISRIESKSESLRQTFAKDLTESRNYVNKLRSAIMDMGFENEFLDEDSVEMFNEILSKYPELAKFKDTFASGGQAKDFLHSNEWNDFLATLPQAYAYLESIGYDFEKISQKTDVVNNINEQSNALQRLEEENEALQQQVKATTAAEEELGDVLDYWSKTDDTSAIDAQITATERLEEENENLRRSYQELENRYNDSQSNLRGEEEYSHSLYSDWQEEKQKLITEQELTAELQKQNEELKERNKALEAGQQPNTGVTSEFKDKQQVVVGVANNEVGALSALRDAINLVIDAVNEKTQAFEKEGQMVDQVIMNEELTALDVLSGYLVGLKRDVDAVTDSFKGIKLDVDMTNTDTNAIDKFVKSLSKLNEEKIDNNLIKVFVRLDDFAQAVNKIKIDDSSILASINNLLNKSKDLENLANALKENKKKIKEAAEEAEGKPKNYKEKYNSTLDDAITSTIRDIDYLEKKGKNTDAYFVKYKDYLEQLHDLSEKKLDFVSEDDYKQLMDLLDAIKAVRKEASLAINKETNAKSVQKYLGQVNDLLSKNNNRKFKKTDEYKDLVELQGLLKSFDTSRPQSELDELGQKVLEVIARVKGLDESLKGGGFLSAFNHRLADMNAKFFAQYFSFQDIIRYAREAFNVIEDLNAQMVELAKVSEQSLKKIEGDFNSYASVAKDLGATISDTISATADWARMGYNVPDSQELARVALLYKNVGDGIDITSANQSLISTLQGYQMQADQAEHIVDVFNEVANNYAIDTAGIGEALQRSAASLNAANTSLEESVALVTAANTVVQNPESVGTTFKTLSARIRGAKTELSDLGEEEDEFTETTSKLRDLIKGLTGFDILESDEQTFKSIYDILVGIGKEWKNLSDIEQASLGEALAGKRNANTLYAILDNIDTLTNAYETAENAAGSAQREQENYEKGIEYSVNRAKAALQELAFDAINSDFLKGLIDFGTNAINLLDTIIDKFGLLKTAIIAIGTVWGTKNLG